MLNVNGLMQKKRNSSVLAMELPVCLFGIKPLLCFL